MVVLVHTVETGTSLMETDCHFLIVIFWWSIELSSEFIFLEEVQLVVYHLVSIAVKLRPEQSTVILLERQSMWDCMTVEVYN